MSVKLKRFIVFALTAVLSVCFCLSSSALSTNQYGLGLTAQASQDKISFTVKNSNSFDVQGISIAPTVPVNLKLMSDGVYSADTLKAGESISGSFAFAAGQASVPAAKQAEESTSPAKAVLVAAGTALLLAVAIFAAVKGLKHKKAIAMLLAVAFMLPVLSMFSVHAAGVDNLCSFKLEENVNINGEEYPITLTVYYTANSAKNSYFEFETADDKIPPENATVTRFTTDFSGTAAANGTVKSVSYTVKSEAYGEQGTVTGTAQLDGCEWSAAGLDLKPGKNEITFTATLDNGQTQTETHVITYDSGEVYKHSNDEVKEENGTKYIENMLNIFFEVGTSDERIEEILAAENAVRIGEINGAIMVQARVITKDLSELEAKCEVFNKYDEVVLAEINSVLDLELNATPVYPNDTWYNNTNYSYSWDESMPAGNNWSAEAVQAPSAWAYDKYYNNVAVGVVDGGFHTGHEDFDNLITFPSSLYENDNDPSSAHGTHVSGIIGAKANNGKGITGLLWDVNILGARYTTGSSDTVDNVVAAVTAVVEGGAKAVNLSIGFDRSTSDGSNPYTNRYTEYELAQTAGPCAVGMDALLEQGKEFVVVQSAGNGTIDTRIGSDSRRSDDAVQNGLYCSIKNTRTYGSLSINDVKNVYDRILVVGAVQNLSSKNNGIRLYMSEFSNGGDRVDIYAPGSSVFSCIPNTKNSTNTNDTTIYKYAYMSGTSQAAPHVTAIAGLCFAINPNLTGAQVKAIICDDANSAYTALDYSLVDEASRLDYHPFEGDGKVISMKLCAEAALRTVCGKASYSYLNMVVAAAQDLNPNDYTNYDTVQAVIDSIDYNLYEFEQDKVSAKANELIAAMDKLEERQKASYTSVEAAIAEVNKLNPDNYVDFSGVTAAVNAVDYGKYADEQAQVEKMAQDILAAIAALEPKQRLESSYHDVIIDNNQKIIVATPESINELSSCLSAGAYTLSLQPNQNGNYSTGSTVTATSGSNSVVYMVAVLGDINGDAQSNGEDAFIVSLYVNGLINNISPALLIAFDADCSGTVDSEDVALLERIGLYNDVIINTYTGS